MIGLLAWDELFVLECAVLLRTYGNGEADAVELPVSRHCGQSRKQSVVYRTEVQGESFVSMMAGGDRGVRHNYEISKNS